MRTTRTLTKTCRCCGDPFQTRSGRARYCTGCHPLVSSALAVLQKQGVPGGQERIDRAVEIARRRVEDARAPRVERVCVTCGAKFIGKAIDEFCAECRAEGLDFLHAYSGWTNGWDRTKVEHVEAEDGWRGRPVAGGAHGRRSLFGSGMRADD